MISKRIAPSYKWRETCSGWTLLDSPNLHVIQESMPSGTHELRHVHDHVQQLYFVLEGEATIEIDKRIEIIRSGEAISITPRAIHRMMNQGKGALEFLVISSTAPRADRRDLE